MTAYTLAANANLRDIGNASIWGVTTARSGGDTVDTNGFKLTIDQDSRYGLSGTTSTTWGNLTINASKGGEIHIDGTKVWMIPFTGGSGTLTLGTQITIGGITCNTIGIHTSLTAAPATTGASGWLKVTNASGRPGTIADGTYAGFTLTANGAAIRGFIEVNGDDSSNIVANRLAAFRVTGEWFELGNTNGSSNQTLQAPNNALPRYLAGVYIATTAPRSATYTWTGSVATISLTGHGYYVGQRIEVNFTSGGASGRYTVIVAIVSNADTFSVVFAGSGTSGNCEIEFLEFWPNAGTTTTTGTEEARGKVVWIDANGLVRIGNSGAATNGYTPPSGRRVVIPNILFECNTAATRTANVIPSTTVGTRYDFVTSGGGVLEIDKGNFAWYLSVSQAFSCNITDSCFVDAISLSEVSSAMTLNKVGVGNKPTTALLVSPLTMTYCYAGGTFTDCVFARVSMSASGAHVVAVNDIDGFSFVRNTFRANTIRGNATTYALTATRMKNCTFINHTNVQGPLYLATCENITVTGLAHIEAVSGTTTSAGTYAYNLALNTINCTFSGLTLPVTNNHPYIAILTAATGCSNIKLRNIGTRSAPLSLGSATACGLVYSLSTNCQNFKFQRIYVSNTRTGIMTGDNSSKNIIEENVFGDYADAVDVMACLNMRRKGMGGTGALTAQTSVYGTHWMDLFTSTTAGRIALLMNEPTAQSSSLVTLTGGANFTSAGGLYMPTIGMTATFELDYYCLGHTGFQNSALVMAGGTVGNYQFEYSIDKNDGAGFSVMTSSSYTAAQLGTALNGLTGIDASKGIKLKLKITTGTTNTTAITSVYLLTNSSTTAQDYQYPLDLLPISIYVKDGDTLGAIENAHVYLYRASDKSVIVNGSTNAIGLILGETSLPAGTAVGGWVRQWDLSGTDYEQRNISGEIGSGGFTSTILLTPA
jgi:hypothetical protein